MDVLYEDEMRIFTSDRMFFSKSRVMQSWRPSLSLIKVMKLGHFGTAVSREAAEPGSLKSSVDSQACRTAPESSGPIVGYCLLSGQ